MSTALSVLLNGISKMIFQTMFLAVISTSRVSGAMRSIKMTKQEILSQLKSTLQDLVSATATLEAFGMVVVAREFKKRIKLTQEFIDKAEKDPSP